MGLAWISLNEWRSFGVGRPKILPFPDSGRALDLRMTVRAQNDSCAFQRGGRIVPGWYVPAP
jgi:hypothetical protein